MLKQKITPYDKSDHKDHGNCDKKCLHINNIFKVTHHNKIMIHLYFNADDVTSLFFGPFKKASENRGFL